MTDLDAKSCKADIAFAASRHDEAFTEYTAMADLSHEQFVFQAISGYILGEQATTFALSSDILETPQIRSLVANDLLMETSKLDDKKAQAHLIKILVESNKISGREVVGWASQLQANGVPVVATDLLLAALSKLPDQPVIKTKALQLYILNKKIEEAGAMAQQWPEWETIDSRLAHFLALALSRSKAHSSLIGLYEHLGGKLDFESKTIATVLDSYLHLNRHEEAIQIGEKAITKGITSDYLHYAVGNCYDALGKVERAIEQYTYAVKLSPDMISANAALGRLLLINRQPKQAEARLAKVVEQAPNLIHPLLLQARALRQLGKRQEAATLMASIPEDSIQSNITVRKQVVAALSMAGRKDEALVLYEQILIERAEDLPASFAEGLKQIDNKIDTVSFPQNRLDWAWSKREKALWPEDKREEWERRAKWGYLADELIMNWAECHNDKVDEIMAILADLAPADALLQGLRDEGHKRGLIVSAHIGALYAGPIALDLLELDTRLLTSIPSVANNLYGGKLISAGDQTEIEVGQEILRALRNDDSVAIVIDGIMSMSAPKTEFEGQQITYSTFAARLAYQMKLLTYFALPYWNEDGKIDFQVTKMPDPNRDEDAKTFTRRWRKAFFDEVRKVLRGRPENLRLSGGLWQGIK